MTVSKLRKMYDMIPAIKQSAFREAVMADKGFSRPAFYLLINREIENISAGDRRIIVQNFKKIGMNSPFVKKRKNNAKSTDKKRVRSCSDESLDRAE